MDPKRVVVVTGASSGIGLALAERAARGGFDVVAVGRRVERLDRLHYDVDGAIGKILTIPLDVTSADAARTIAHAALDRFGRIDILVNNAGGVAVGPVSEQSDEALREQVDTHIVAPLALLREMLPSLVERRGHVFFVGSGVARIPVSDLGAYPGVKAAVRNFSRTVRTDLRRAGIAVTYVDPGAVATEFMTRAGFAGPPALLSASPVSVARRIYAAFSTRPSVVNGVPWQTAFVAVGESLPGVTDWFLSLAPGIVGGGNGGVGAVAAAELDRAFAVPLASLPEPLAPPPPPPLAAPEIAAEPPPDVPTLPSPRTPEDDVARAEHDFVIHAPAHDAGALAEPDLVTELAPVAAAPPAAHDAVDEHDAPPLDRTDAHDVARPLDVARAHDATPALDVAGAARDAGDGANLTPVAVAPPHVASDTRDDASVVANGALDRDAFVSPAATSATTVDPEPAPSPSAAFEPESYAPLVTTAAPPDDTSGAISATAAETKSDKRASFGSRLSRFLGLQSEAPTPPPPPEASPLTDALATPFTATPFRIPPPLDPPPLDPPPIEATVGAPATGELVPTEPSASVTPIDGEASFEARPPVVEPDAPPPAPPQTPAGPEPPLATAGHDTLDVWRRPVAPAFADGVASSAPVGSGEAPPSPWRSQSSPWLPPAIETLGAASLPAEAGAELPKTTFAPIPHYDGIEPAIAIDEVVPDDLPDPVAETRHARPEPATSDAAGAPPERAPAETRAATAADVHDDYGAETAPADASPFEIALSTVARRMRKLNLSHHFLARLLIPGDVLFTGDVALRWAGMPNKNERALTSEALHVLADAGYLERLEHERYLVLKGAKD